MTETQEETMGDAKGQPEQLVEEARRRKMVEALAAVPKHFEPGERIRDYDALATALSECRERREEAGAILRHYHATIRHVIDDSPGTPESVKEYLRKSIRSHDLLAAQPPSEAGTVDDDGTEHCGKCGRPYFAALGDTYWNAPNELWNEVEGNEGGLRCPSCFTEDCRARGIHIYWQVTEYSRGPLRSATGLADTQREP